MEKRDKVITLDLAQSGVRTALAARVVNGRRSGSNAVEDIQDGKAMKAECELKQDTAQHSTAQHSRTEWNEIEIE